MDKKLNFHEITNLIKEKSSNLPKELVEYLSRQGHDLFNYPYRATLSDETEQYEHTYESGNKAMITRHFANVFQITDNEEKYIGKYELGGWKGARVDGTFCPILRNGKWYALVSPQCGIKIYSLPELELIAETAGVVDGYVDQTRITDIYCPRIASELCTYKSGGEECAYHMSWIDGEIESDPECTVEWESAPFAFVESYDPYCSGTNYVRMVDLRNIESGEISYYKDFFVSTPGWIPIRKYVNMQDWSKEFPSIQIASEQSYSSINGTTCGNSGWDTSQLDYFSWIGETPDPRTHNERRKKEWNEWISSDKFHKLESLLGITYVQYENKWDTCHSREEAIELAKSDPNQLKHRMLIQWKRGALINNAYLVHGLQYFLPDENIKQLLLLVTDPDEINGEYASAEAIMILSKYYPDDKNIQTKLKKMKRSKDIRLANQINNLEKEKKYDARITQ